MQPKQLVKRFPLWIEPAIAEIPELKSSLISNNKTVESTAFSELHQVEKYKSDARLAQLTLCCNDQASRKNIYIFTTYPLKQLMSLVQMLIFFIYFLKIMHCVEENKQTYSFGNNEIKRVEEDKEALDEINLFRLLH